MRQALERCQDKGVLERMKVLANTFLKNRQMGEPEAVYKLIPSMSMTNSNVTCQWVCVDRDEVKTKRMRRATKQDQEAEKVTVQIEDMEGDWLVQWDIRDKYIRRPKNLHHLPFSHFARIYCAASKGKEKEERADDEEKQDIPDSAVNNDNPFAPFKTVAGCEQVCCKDPPRTKLTKRGSNFPKIIDLPKAIVLEDPHAQEQQHMRRRNMPAALRWFKAKEAKDPMRYFFQQLVLYVPFGRPENQALGTENLLNLADDDVQKLYVRHQKHIKVVQGKVMPFLEDVEEQRFFVEEARLDEPLNLDDVGEELAPGKEQDNMDAENAGPEDAPDYDHLNPSELDQEPEAGYRVVDYGSIIVPNKEELIARTKQLDPEQRRVLDISITYARDLLKAQKTGKRLTPPHIMVHGAAGTGKSTVIDLISLWCQSILQKAGDSPDQPFVLKTAFTGTAAANIEGQTLSTTFGFVHGNKYFPLNDRNRDPTRLALKNLVLVIIDEISLVKADMLYMLSLKLQEIKQRSEPFGGVMIAAFGDIFQLKPVFGKYTWTQPSSSTYHLGFRLDNLWEKLTVINLVTNHRQAAGGAFADLLNRLRFVKQTDMLPGDIKTLESRVRPSGHPDINNATFNIVSTVAKAHEMNTTYLNNLPGPLIIIKAINYTANQREFSPRLSPKDGQISSTGFLDELKLKLGAKVMLIKNLDTRDFLTNGQTGILMDIVRDNKGAVRYLIVRFDREGAGRRAREREPQLVLTYPGGTKIEKTLMTYSLDGKGGGAQATLIQFPIRVAHAVTAHKIQGMTIHWPRTVAMDLASCWDAAIGYVMLGRAQFLEQIYIMDRLVSRKIYAAHEALAEYEKMNKRALNNQTKGWFPEQLNTTKVLGLNIARLQPHLGDLLSDPTLQKADLIHLCETWLKPGDDTANLAIPGYTANFTSVGNGRGIATYHQAPFQHKQDVVRDDWQITCFTSPNLDSLHVYRSSNSCLPDLITDLRTLIDDNKPTLITGDFNICLRSKPNNQLSLFLSQAGFKQLNGNPTHVGGGQLDHAYLREGHQTFEEAQLHRYSPYYSDHDALCVTLTTPQVLHLIVDILMIHTFMLPFSGHDFG